MKPIAVANVRYWKAGEDGLRQLRDVARYFQQRDGSVRRQEYLRLQDEMTSAQIGEIQNELGLNDAAQNATPDQKWVSRGLGTDYRDIVEQCRDWSGRSVAARTLVISPDPELMQHIPEELRYEVVQNVTEQTVEQWYEANGWGDAQYSYVLHDKHRSQDGMQMAHAHVVVPGSISVPGHGRIDHVVKKPHLRNLIETTEGNFEQELGRVLGQEQAQSLIQERNERIEKERREAWKQRVRQRKIDKRVAAKLKKQGIDPEEISEKDWEQLEESAEMDMVRDARKQRVSKRFAQARAVGDAMKVLDDMKKKKKDKRGQNEMRLVRLLMAARHFNEKDDIRRRNDEMRRSVTRHEAFLERKRERDEAYKGDLSYARVAEEQRQGRIRREDIYVPTAKEKRERKAQAERRERYVDAAAQFGVDKSEAIREFYKQVAFEGKRKAQEGLIEQEKRTGPAGPER